MKAERLQELKRREVRVGREERQDLVFFFLGNAYEAWPNSRLIHCRLISMSDVEEVASSSVTEPETSSKMNDDPAPETAFQQPELVFADTPSLVTSLEADRSSRSDNLFRSAKWYGRRTPLSLYDSLRNTIQVSRWLLYIDS